MQVLLDRRARRARPGPGRGRRRRSSRGRSSGARAGAAGAARPAAGSGSETTPAVIRCDELDHGSRRRHGDDAARRRAASRACRCRPGPQPSPESLTRTTPPIRIRTKVATMVAVDEAAEPGQLGGFAAAGRDGIHRAQDTDGSSPRSAAVSGSDARVGRRDRRPRVRQRLRRRRRGGQRRGRDVRGLPLADRLADVAQRLGAADVGDGVEVVRRGRREREPLERRAAPRIVAHRAPARCTTAALTSVERGRRSRARRRRCEAIRL